MKAFLYVFGLLALSVSAPVYAGIVACRDALIPFQAAVEDSALVRLTPPSDRSLDLKMAMLQHWHQQSEELATSIDRAIAELNEELSPQYLRSRRTHDLRWFGGTGLRRDATNPYTLRLRERLARASTRKASIAALRKAAFAEKLGSYLTANRETLGAAQRFVFGSLVRRANQLWLAAIDEQGLKLLPEIDKLTADTDAFVFGTSAYGYDKKVDPLWSSRSVELAQKLQSRRARQVAQVIHRPTDFSEQMFAIAAASKNNFIATVKVFETIDGLSLVRRPNRGLYDATVVGLTQVTLNLRVDANKVVSTFFELDRIGRETKPWLRWNITDAALVLLTEEAIRFQRRPAEVIEMFYEMVRAWHLLQDDFSMDDLDLARLTVLSLTTNTSASLIFGRYLNLYSLANPGLSSAMSDPAVIDLVELAMDTQKSPEQILTSFKAFDKEQTEGARSLGMAEKLLVFRAAVRSGGSVEEAGRAVRLARSVDLSASDAHIAWMVVRSLEAKRVLGDAQPLTQEELYIAAHVPGYPATQIAQWMRWKMSEEPTLWSSFVRAIASGDSDSVHPWQGMATGNGIHLDVNYFPPF